MQPARVVCQFGKKHLGLVVVVENNRSKGGDGDQAECKTIMTMT